MTVPGRVRAVLERVGPVLCKMGFYLGGGTALALRFGHRESTDLDWFTGASFDPEEAGRLLEGKVLLAERGTVHAEVDGVRVSLFHYPYPVLGELEDMGGVRVASVLDLGLMKLVAVANRGARKDFLDLYVIARRAVPLGDLVARVREKYGDRFDVVHLCKSLVYFEDAEADPMPRVAPGLEWEPVKAWFVSEVPGVARGLGLV